MLHIAILSVRNTLLFHTWAEAKALWDLIVQRVRHHGMALMPDHLHALLGHAAQVEALHRAMRAFARWRNAERGERGPVFRHGALPDEVPTGQHLDRTRRYIHLNPCRAGLVKDPLAWPFSTHRDAVGLALPPVIQPVADPERFHAYVSSDPKVAVQGTPLPRRAALDDRARLTLAQVRAAVSALTREPASALARRGPARSLLIDAAAHLLPLGTDELATALDVDPTTVRRHAERLGDKSADARITLVATVASDPRFALPAENDLRRTAAWTAYRARVKPEPQPRRRRRRRRGMP